MQESREATLAVARAQSAMLSCAYQAVMQGDARHFDGKHHATRESGTSRALHPDFVFWAEAVKTDKEILARLDSSLLTAQAFPPTYISTPIEAGLTPP